MTKSTQELRNQLDAAVVQWRANPRHPDAQLMRASMTLLADVFVQAPIGAVDDLIDPGLALAAFIRALSNPNDPDVFDAEIRHSAIQKNPNLRKDPGDRLQALLVPARVFLTHGMMEKHAICVEAIGDAQLQLERWMDASISYRLALKICDRLGLRQHVPRLLLCVAQAFRYESVRGRVDWETTLSYFDECYASLEHAPITERERNHFRAACLIDRMPCYVEIPREKLQRGTGSVQELREGIARARRDLKQGIALAKQDPDLGQYVRQGETNLLRLDGIEDALAGT